MAARFLIGGRMDINEILTKNFPEVNKAFFEKEAGIRYLRVEVKHTKMSEIAELSKEINTFLDNNDPSDENYYLDIFSPGTDQTFDPKNSDEYIGENVLISLKKHVKEKNEYIGELLSFDGSEIIVKWNAKGQFRKQAIAIDNIELIKKYIKAK